ncbi:PXA domain-containing protein [Podospora fimiseda]|uniref:PXA domain-containing protein n=1 Tax=Podospora fimiseda TaxID=252190 RepID=A0AAN7BQJ2_9PEZI|nr:PXA domain-containing protein [Podospora fimiseda]
MMNPAAQTPARGLTPRSSTPSPSPATARQKPSRTSSFHSESSFPSKPRSANNNSNNAANSPSTITAEFGQASGAAIRRGPRQPPLDPLSDKATALLIRRILFPQHLEKAKNSSASIEDLPLPPLTSRNDVDLQLYALIAIILREYVQNWYTKITPDETFVAEIVQIIAHITRALEQRLRKVDLESLLLDEIPELLDRHITAYRVARDPITHHPVRTNPREIYHSLCPLPALSPVPRHDDPATVASQAENEVAYRQLLVQAVLAILLPTEDLENGCLTALVGQIFSELIIGNSVANKLSEPWLIYELFIIISRIIGQRKQPVQRDENASGRPNKDPTGARSSSSIQDWFWRFIHWIFLATSFIRLAFSALMTSRSLPSRTSRGISVLRKNEKDATHHQEVELEPSSESSKTPVLAFRIWSAISNLIEMDTRMPWLCGALSMLQWVSMTGPGQIAAVDGRLDRLLSHGIHKYLLDSRGLPPLLRNVRGALFPNNAPGKPTLVPPASEEELRALRTRCARALWRGVVPNGLARVYFTGKIVKSDTDDKGKNKTAAVVASASVAVTAVGANKKTRQKDPSPTGRTARGGAGSGDHQQHDGGYHHGHRRQKSRKTNNNASSGISGSGSGSGGGSSRSGSPSTPLGEGGEKKNEDEDDDEVDQEILEEIEQGILSVFEDGYCNKHLVYGILELVLVRLMPELAERGALELWAERVPVSVVYL